MQKKHSRLIHLVWVSILKFSHSGWYSPSSQNIFRCAVLRLLDGVHGHSQAYLSHTGSCKKYCYLSNAYISRVCGIRTHMLDILHNNSPTQHEASKHLHRCFGVIVCWFPSGGMGLQVSSWLKDERGRRPIPGKKQGNRNKRFPASWILQRHRSQKRTKVQIERAQKVKTIYGILRNLHFSDHVRLLL